VRASRAIAVLVAATGLIAATGTAFADPPGGEPPGGGHTPATICHKPGTPAEQTLVVDDNAVPGHLGHGDFEGPCAKVTPPTPEGPAAAPAAPSAPVPVTAAARFTG
jgi:hypothetical protein